MKNIVIIYKSDDWQKKIPISNLNTRKAFEDWYKRGHKVGVKFYRASIDWFDLDNYVFKKAWTFENDKWLKVRKAIRPNLIFDKVSGKYDYELFELKKRISQKVEIFNDPYFRTIFNNKLSQYMILSDFMPQTIVVNSNIETERALKKIKSNLVVAKPLYGSGGFGIMIDEKKVIRSAKLEYPILLQEFIETTGVPGISTKKEVSDLRLVYLNHRIGYALSRIAQRGSLFTNFHQGAQAVLVLPRKIPDNVRKIADEIVKKIGIFPKANYSLDFIFDKSGKPFLVEINTTPGFDLLNTIGTEEIKEKYFSDFIKAVF